MNTFRAIFRAILLMCCLIFHIVWIVVPAIFRGHNLDHAIRTSQLWVGWVLKQMGVRVAQHGSPPAGCHIFIGNHRSYLDGIIPMNDARALPVVKAEVSDWPLIGYGAKLTGIIFVKRESKQSRTETLESMHKSLKMGYSVLVYPEGTTHLEPTTIDFRTGAFNLAAKNGFSIVPMAIDYADADDAWVGDEPFLPHFLRCFGKKRTHVRIHYGQPLLSDDTEFLVSVSKKWIDENMLLIRKEFDEAKTSQTVSAFAG